MVQIGQIAGAYISPNTTTISNIATSSPYVTLSGYDYDDLFSTTTFGSSIISFLSEAEIIELLEKLKNRGEDKDDLQKIVKEIILSRHCSEQFILDWLDIQSIDKELARKILGKMHKSEINSGEYAQIALLLKLEDLGN